MFPASTPLFPDISLAPPCLDQNLMKRVLLVEDDPSTRWLVRSALKDRCDLMTAGDGEQAVDVYTRCMPEVVFLDLNLPGKNGDKILDMILEKDPGAFVVVMSGPQNLDILLTLCARGAKGLVTKPYAKADILYYLLNSPALR